MGLKEKLAEQRAAREAASTPAEPKVEPKVESKPEPTPEPEVKRGPGRPPKVAAAKVEPTLEPLDDIKVTVRVEGPRDIFFEFPAPREVVEQAEELCAAVLENAG